MSFSAPKVPKPKPEPEPVDLAAERGQEAFSARLRRPRSTRATILSTMADAVLKEKLGT